jgi:hypothetical protein
LATVNNPVFWGELLKAGGKLIKRINN